jgi:tetratricopeptide (TPR) repeat protein
VPLRTELTSADLLNIRQSAPGAADPLGVAAELAGAAGDGLLADPQDAGLALMLAAEIAESRAKFEAALRYAERAVEAYGARDDSQAGAARALRARLLFRAGRHDEAMAELEPLRPMLTRFPEAPVFLTAALGVGGHHRLAEQWLTEAVTAALAERAGQSTEPASPEDAGQLLFLLQQRHQVRHLIGLPHDAHDNLAERLEHKLAVTSAGAAAGPADQLVFWPRDEFDTLIGKWPALATAVGATWDEHRARLEQALVRQAEPTLLPGTASGLSRVAGSDGDPADAKTLAAYARQLAASSARVAWPPERNGACWCGSGGKYKKCCLPRSRD